jgi:DNA-binding XRE family transcriptional regulator
MQNWRIPVAGHIVIWVNGYEHIEEAINERAVVVRRTRLSQRRKMVGLSQEKLAEIIGVDRSTVVRWEAADTEPQPWHRPKLARALKVSIEELAVLLADVGQAPARPDERFDYALTHPSAVDLIAVGYLRQQIACLDEQYDRQPSSLLLAETGQLHGQAVYLRAHAMTGKVRRELWAAEAESALLMGQLIWDASQRRDHDGPTIYFDRAANAAGEAGDPVLDAYAQLRKSYIALYGQNDPRTGLVQALRASAAARHRSPVVAGLATLHVGEAHAMLGDRHQCQTALGHADEHFARTTADDPAAALYCPTTPGRLAGSCYLALGQPAAAEPILDATHKLLQQAKKSTAIVVGNLSLACIRQHKLDEAVAHLHTAIEVLEQTRGGGGLNIAFTAARELRPWRDQAAVGEVSDRLLRLMTAA